MNISTAPALQESEALQIIYALNKLNTTLECGELYKEQLCRRLSLLCDNNGGNGTEVSILEDQICSGSSLSNQSGKKYIIRESL